MIRFNQKIGLIANIFQWPSLITVYDIAFNNSYFESAANYAYEKY